LLVSPFWREWGQFRLVKLKYELAFEKVSFLKFKFEKWCKNNNEKSTHAEEKLEKGSNFDRRDQSDKRLPLRATSGTG
jgi:triacylglycerol esterase/lipase EstA (alpha/beta hydrolase family)